MGKLRSYPGLIAVVLLLLSGFFALMSDVFLTWPNILNIFTASATIGILAIGAAFVIGAGGLDLSVGSLMALSAVVAVTIVPDSSFFILLICFAVGAAAGGANGYLIGRFRLPPFIVTLGMLSLARGVALIVTEGQPVYGLPDFIVFLGQGRLGGIPIPCLIFVGAGVTGHILLRHTKLGAHSLAMGDNEKAARNAGIRIIYNRVVLYALSGAAAALAGLLFMGRINAADPAAGTMYELTAITAAMIGGTSLSGGRASVLGAMTGALIMGVLQNGFTHMDVPAYYQQVAIGIMLVAAVSFGRWRGVHAPAD